MFHFTLKSGTNKGNRRIWIEGNRLIEAGLPCGTPLFRTHEHDVICPIGDMVLSTCKYEDRPLAGKHKVAGTHSRPIIDLCGKWVTAFIGDHTHVGITVVEYSNGERALLIRPENV
jgi:hypothetical protein